MSAWKQIGENLVRHESGTIYLRAKVSGKVIRRSLGTTDVRVAKLKRDDLLEAIRREATVSRSGIRSLGGAVRSMREKVLASPHLRPTSVTYYEEILGILEETLPSGVLAKSFSPAEARAWWKTIAKAYSPQRANNLLGMAKRIGEDLVERGIRIDDPFAGLQRVKITARPLNVPSREKLEEIVGEIRRQGKAFSEVSANFVAFLAFSGCRMSQARALTWKDVKPDWIEFRGGVTGTKGASTRRLPINPPLREVLERMRAAGSVSGLLFEIQSPRDSLWAACSRLKVSPVLRLHDLRHFFASWAIESGIDVPTVSRWLGHKDGGALLMRTYSHLRDDHSLEAASRLS